MERKNRKENDKMDSNAASLVHSTWKTIQNVCKGDDTLLDSIKTRLRWEETQLCGVQFNALYNLDFRKRAGKKLKPLLRGDAPPLPSATNIFSESAPSTTTSLVLDDGGNTVETGDVVVNDTVYSSTYAADAQPKRKGNSGSKREGQRRKRLKIIGNLLFNMSRQQWILSESGARSSAMYIARFVTAAWTRIIRHTQGACVFVPRRSTNRQDCVTLCDIECLPRQFFFSFCESGHHYAFDIRSLHHLIQANSANPYTMHAFDVKVIAAVQRRVLRLQHAGVSLSTDDGDDKDDVAASMTMAPEEIAAQQRRLRACAICQSLDKLVALTNIEWILGLNASLLLDWWIHVEDIVNYRAKLSPEKKAKIIPSLNQPNAIFNKSGKGPLWNQFKKPNLEHNHDKIFDFVIGEMERLINEPHDNEDCVLGAMYVLTGLCSCSEGARTTLPWLYQPSSPSD